jgi:LysR family nitrogen assimilation transcriptional regulator
MGQMFMDLRQIQYFLKVANSGSFTRAAAELGIAQPALSRQLKRLEEELGVTLLHRHGRGVTTTQVGVGLVQNAGIILAQVDVALKDIIASKDVLSGNATVGLPPSVGRVLSLPLARHFREHFPNVRLRIIEAFSGTILESLRSGRIDAALLYKMEGVEAPEAEPIAKEELMLVGRPQDDAPLVGKSVPFRNLPSLKLVLPSPIHGLRARIDQVARRERVKLKVELEVDGLHSMLETVRHGLGYTILQSSAIQDELADGKLRSWPITEPVVTLTLCIATGIQRSTAISTRRLAAILRQLGRSFQRKAHWRRPP